MRSIDTLGPAKPYEEIEQLRADRDSLRKALDDRWATDLKAAKAIFAETGRAAGFPSVKEVVAFYVAEGERLEKERDSLRAKLEKAKEALSLALLYAHPAPQDFVGQESYVTAISDIGKARAILSELSADAPAQPPQISDDVRALLDEAIAALEFFESDEHWCVNGKLDPNGPNFIGRIHARAGLTKLKAARNENR